MRFSSFGSMKKRFLMVKTSLEHISKLILAWKRPWQANPSPKIDFFKIALNRVLTLPNARSRREVSKSSGIIEIENKNISVVTKHWKYRIWVPKSILMRQPRATQSPRDGASAGHRYRNLTRPARAKNASTDLWICQSKMTPTTNGSKFKGFASCRRPQKYILNKHKQNYQSLNCVQTSKNIIRRSPLQGNKELKD